MREEYWGKSLSIKSICMNNKKIVGAILAVLVLFGAVLLWPSKKPAVVEETAKQPIAVSVQAARDSKTFVQKKQFPATVVGDQEIMVTAKSSGTIVIAPSDIGSKVTAGSLMAKIDDVGNQSTIGQNGFESAQIQGLEQSVRIAKESLDVAEKIYKSVKSIANRGARDIAQRQYDSAQVALSGGLDAHLITTPISGTLVSKNVSVGDSVSVGQLIATVSKSANIKVQFFVDQEQRNSLVKQQEVTVLDVNGNAIPFYIKNISIVADPITKRFLVEAYPTGGAKTEALLSGTVLTVSLVNTLHTSDPSYFLLPLSSMSIGQNEDSIYSVENNTAKKVIVTLVKVQGEMAEVSSEMSPDTQIIIQGNKLVHEGGEITIEE